MPHPLVVGLFRERWTAAAAARDLRAQGVEKADLSIVAADHRSEGQIAEDVGGTPGAEIEDSQLASRLGELSGFVLAAIAIGLPGTGAVVAAGPLAAELGEAAGHVVGHLSSALMKAGLSEAEAVEWEAEVHEGAVLLGVHVRGLSQAQMESLLTRHGAKRVVHAEWED